jgi:hypothetical protein
MPAFQKRRTCTLTEAAYRLRQYNTGRRFGARQAASLVATEPDGHHRRRSRPEVCAATVRLPNNRKHAALACNSILSQGPCPRPSPRDLPAIPRRDLSPGLMQRQSAGELIGAKPSLHS